MTDQSFEIPSSKVLVTGVAGFIGSHLAEKLLQMGAEVIGLDDLSAGKMANLHYLNSYPRFSFTEADVCETGPVMSEIFNDLDAVFHNAASKKNVCLRDPKRDLKVNAEGTLNLLLMAHEHGVRKFVHASTGSVYGEPSVFPTDESHPLNPVSYYGVSKLAGERYVEAFHSLHGLDTTILRYFHVYGPRQESNEFGGVVSIFMRAINEGRNPVIFGSGEQVRSFTHVDDLVKANIGAALNPVATGKVYNVASGVRVSVKDLALNMVRLSGREDVQVEYAPALPGDIINFDVDNSRVCQDLGLSFNTDFWDTLAECMHDPLAFLNLDSE